MGPAKLISYWFHFAPFAPFVLLGVKPNKRKPWQPVNWHPGHWQPALLMPPNLKRFQFFVVYGDYHYSFIFSCSKNFHVPGITINNETGGYRVYGRKIPF